MTGILLIISIGAALVILVTVLRAYRLPVSEEDWFNRRIFIFGGGVGAFLACVHIVNDIRFPSPPFENSLFSIPLVILAFLLHQGYRNSREYIAKRKEIQRALSHKGKVLDALVARAPIFVFRVAPSGEILSLDGDVIQKLAGSNESLVGKNIFEIHGHSPAFKKNFEKALNGEEVTLVQQVRGEIFEFYVFPHFDENSRIVGVGGIGINVTALKKAQEALRLTELQYSALAEAAQDFIFLIGEDERVRWVNSFAANSFHIKPEMITGKSLSELFPPLVADRMLSNLRAVFKTGIVTTHENPAVFPTGEQWLHTRLLPIKNDEGRIFAVMGLSRDLTDRKKQEQALEASEARYRLLWDQAGEGIAVFDNEARYIDLNDKACQILGYPKQEILGFSALKFLAPESVETVQTALGQIRERPSREFDVVISHKDGSKRELRVNGTVLPDGRLFALLTDITERKIREKAVAEEREKLRVTLEAIGDAVISTDPSGKIALMNPMAERYSGVPASEAIGKPFDEVFRILGQPSRQPETEFFRKTVSLNGEEVSLQVFLLQSREEDERLISRGSSPIVGDDGKPSGFVLVLRDITEQRRLEDELLQAQKLESVGILAGGLAHDFNNILTCVLGNISLAQMRANADPFLFARLTDAEKAVYRARDLTYQLLTFSKGGAPVRKSSSLEEILKESVEFTLRGSNLSHQLDIPPDLWMVEIDEGQISRVISNLIINAKQSMPDGGTIRIDGRNVALGEDDETALKPGKYVQITVKDQGTGIAPEVLPKIFDPYFTTKTFGNGLGLATSYSIIKRHGGHITVKTKIGEGSEFSFFLPGSEGPKPPKKAPAVIAGTGHGRVLVMDDESQVRAVACGILKSLGFEPTEVENGEEALKEYGRAQAENKPFAAVILDLTVPGGLGGKETIQQILISDPKVKAIVSSGYSSDPIMSEFQKFGFSGVIAKPYNIKDFADCFRKIELLPTLNP